MALSKCSFNIQHLQKLLIDLAFPFLEKGVREELNDAGTLRLFNKGDMLIALNEPIKNTFIILNGFVKVYRENIEGSQFVNESLFLNK